MPRAESDVDARLRGHDHVSGRGSLRTKLKGLTATGERPVRWAVDTSVERAALVLLEQVTRDIGDLLRRF